MTAYPCSIEVKLELEQLTFSPRVGDAASRALRAQNQLGVIHANSDLVNALRQNAEVARELNEAEAEAMADERAGKASYRFPA